MESLLPARRRSAAKAASQKENGVGGGWNRPVEVRPFSEEGPRKIALTEAFLRGEPGLAGWMALGEPASRREQRPDPGLWRFPLVPACLVPQKTEQCYRASCRCVRYRDSFLQIRERHIVRCTDLLPRY